VGYWETVDELRDNWQVDRDFKPKMAASDADKMHSRWDEAIERSLDWARDDGGD